MFAQVPAVFQYKFKWILHTLWICILKNYNPMIYVVNNNVLLFLHAWLFIIYNKVTRIFYLWDCEKDGISVMKAVWKWPLLVHLGCALVISSPWNSEFIKYISVQISHNPVCLITQFHRAQPNMLVVIKHCKYQMCRISMHAEALHYFLYYGLKGI